MTTTYIGAYFEWDGTTSRSYYYAGSLRIATRLGTALLNYILGDNLGSTSMTLDNNQAVIAETRYKAYGEEYTASGTQPTTFRFTGQRLDAGIQLYFYNARYYDHIVGRFAQPDSIVPQPGNPQSLNRYSYVLNNPLRYIDPTGRGEQDYYVFVQGCLSSSSPCDPDTAWANYLAYLQNDILKMGSEAFVVNGRKLSHFQRLKIEPPLRWLCGLCTA